MSQGEDINYIGLTGKRTYEGQLGISGIAIERVSLGSATGKIGIRPGDILYAFGDIELFQDYGESDVVTLCDILSSQSPSDVLPIEIYRPSTHEKLRGELNGEPLEVIEHLALSDSLEPPQPNSPNPDLPPTIEPIPCNIEENPDLANNAALRNNFSATEPEPSQILEGSYGIQHIGVHAGRYVHTAILKSDVLAAPSLGVSGVSNFWFCIQSEILSYTNDHNGLYFEFRTGNDGTSNYRVNMTADGAFRFIKNENNNAYILEERVPIEPISPSSRRLTRIEIIGMGPEIQVRIDGETIAQTIDNATVAPRTLKFGIFGPANSAISVAFDNLVIINMDEESGALQIVPPAPQSPSTQPAIPQTPVPQPSVPEQAPPQPSAPTPVAAALTVNATSINLHNQPDANSPVIGTLPKGRRVAVIGKADQACEWVQIQFSSDSMGWVFNDSSIVTMDGHCDRVALVIE